MATQTDPMIGRLLDGRYEVRSRIARGGMATVYLATDLRLERRVAIKVMHDHLSDDSNFKNRFVQEARQAARLAHPNVVSVFDQGQDSDMAYLVMEYLPGITLRELLKEHGRLTAEQAIDIMDAVLSGLAAAHTAGIVHRDLKPENVLLADDGRIKIGDFGLARAATANTASGQALLGTIAYLSPELVTRGIADTRSDIYAIGIMLYEVLTGQQPFQGEQPMQIAYQHANDSVPTPSSKNPAVTDEFDELVLWATARDPDDRPGDAKAMLEGLREVEKSFGRSAGGVIATTAVLTPTMKAPTLPLSSSLGAAQTQVLRGGSSPDAGGSSTTGVGGGVVGALHRTSRARRSRGWWLFLLVLLLAGLGGGTGWYFGSGPGAMVAVPVLTGKTTAAAASALHELGFHVAPVKSSDGVYTLKVDKGLVVQTEPGAGKHLQKGSTVSLRVSLGPRPITLKPLAGMTQKQAEAEITGKDATVGTVAKQFSKDAKKGIVISAAKAGGDHADLSKGGDYFAGSAVNLVVSVGAVPEVSGDSVEEATGKLEAVGLKTGQATKVYSDSVPDGKVVDAHPATHAPVRPGDTMDLDVSMGPKPVPIPDVVGKKWSDAKQALTDAGFKVTYHAGGWSQGDIDSHPDNFKVAATDPNQNTEAKPGSTVDVTLRFQWFSF